MKVYFGEELKAIISDMRKYKSENNLSMKTEMKCLDIETERFENWFIQSIKDLKACSKAIAVNINKKCCF